MPQSARFATLEAFKAGEIRLLVCSDVAARGIDIGGLSHVFNFDVPHHAEDYVHRIGRTGRAGLEGRALTLATPEDRLAVEAIEKLTGHAIPPLVVDGLDPVEWAESDKRGRRRGRAAPTAAPKSSARRTAPVPATEVQATAEREDARAAGRENSRSARGRGRDAVHEAPRDAGRNARRSRDGEMGEDRGIVVGFGEEIPAFMQIRRRAVSAIADPIEAAGFDDDGTDNDDTEIAA
jgi:superfamily II DNA/RNA helicase